MSSYLKRKEKEKAKELAKLAQETVDIAKDLVKPRTVELPPAVLSFKAYDIFHDPVSKKHKAAVISYDPVSGVAKVEVVKEISRSIALLFENDKKALKTIIKEK